MHAKVSTPMRHIEGQEYYDSFFFPGSLRRSSSATKETAYQRKSPTRQDSISKDPHGGQGGIPECLHCSGPSDVRGPQTAKRKTVTIGPICLYRYYQMPGIRCAADNIYMALE